MDWGQTEQRTRHRSHGEAYPGEEGWISIFPVFSLPSQPDSTADRCPQSTADRSPTPPPIAAPIAVFLAFFLRATETRSTSDLGMLTTDPLPLN